MILSNERITKVLIRLRRCADWSAPLLFANPEDRFTHVKAHKRVEYNMAIMRQAACLVIKPITVYGCVVLFTLMMVWSGLRLNDDTTPT